MNDYIKDGREAALRDIREYVMENAPQTPPEKRSMNFLNSRDRVKRLTQVAKEFKERARIPVKWREDLSDRLRIKQDDIVRATNTIIEMMEQELASGGTVRIANFGDIKTIAMIKEDGDVVRMARFYADEQWKRLLNPPLYDSEIGLKHSFVKKKLVRREL